MCAVCEFENFKDALFCCICGERMDTGEATDSGGRNKRKRRRKEKKKEQQQLEQRRNETRAALPRHFTERQQRARKRKEWTRKLDVEGNMFWFRVKEGSGSMAPARVGKVIRFVKPNASSKMPGQVNGPMATQSEVAVVEPAKVKVFAEIADMDIIPATKWDAAARATGEVLEDNTQEGVERRRETLELAGKDFPSSTPTLSRPRRRCWCRPRWSSSSCRFIETLCLRSPWSTSGV